MPVVKKAKCSSNQDALDRLNEKKQAAVGQDRYSMTLKRAMDSLQKATEPITTYQQALDLKYVGKHCASIICPLKKRMREAAASEDDDGSVGSLHSSASAKRNRLGAPAAAAKASQQHTNGSKDDTKSTKQRKYEKVMKEVDNWKQHPQLTWKVVLLIDGREQKSEHVIAKCRMSGIPCEERNLPIGDMAWLARGMKSAKGDNVAVVELMLGTIVERKTPEDLRSSIFGSRYNEQRLRLKHSGLPQVLFLIEGDLKDQQNCPADTLHTAMWETSLHMGFQAVQTEHMEGTVRTLKRIHRRILQRSFPQAFKGDLPIFLEALSTRRPAAGKRRVQSLAEMTFDQDPVLCFDMKRFVTYEELKARIEKDRETGTKTIAGIHLAMLKQVSTFSDKKCKAITQKYPTPHTLFSAYARSTAADGKKLVADISTRDPLRSQRETSIGPKSSKELFLAYGLGNDVEIPACFASAESSAPTTSGGAATKKKPPPPLQQASIPATISVLSPIQERYSPQKESTPSHAVAKLPRKRKSSSPASLTTNRKASTTSKTADASPPADHFDALMAEAIRRSLEEQKKPASAVATSRPDTARRYLDTSLGSLLDDSSDDDNDFLLSQKPSGRGIPSSQEVIEID